MRARSASMSTTGLAIRSSARFFAASARATSISSARSAICARIVTRSGCTSANPNAMDEVVLFLPLPVPQLADRQQRQQRRVARQHAEIPVGARDLHLVDRLVDERPIGGHDLQLDLIVGSGHESGRPLSFYALLRFLELRDDLFDRAGHVELLLRECRRACLRRSP